MARVLLLTTAALACLVVALGCQRERKALDSPRKSIERTTTIWASPPSAPAADPAPMMTTPPVEEVVDTPAFTPDPTPATLAPSRPPSQYRDGCGRPLVA
jgi:hypothetical protein